jgi:hypothetical protein
MPSGDAYLRVARDSAVVYTEKTAQVTHSQNAKLR